MTEKPKKSKKRIPQWQFLLAWIGGQYGAFFGTVLLGLLVMIPLNLMGVSYDMLPNLLTLAIGGAVWGWFVGWVQQWSIRKHFGHDVKGWKTVSAILTAIIMMIMIPLIMWTALNTPFIYKESNSYPLIVSATFMAIFGASGLGQAILLRKHVKHSWLFFMSTLVGGIVYGLPIFGNASSIIAQIAQYSVTAFAILWLFQMSGTMDAMQSEDEALERLTDSETDEAYDDYHGEDEKHQRDNRFTRFLRGLRLTFSQ